MYTGLANVTLTLTLVSLHSLPVIIHSPPFILLTGVCGDTTVSNLDIE